MIKTIASAIAAVALAAIAVPAGATVVVSNSGATLGALNSLALPLGADLRNNGPYASGGSPTAYLFGEGDNAVTDEQTFLLHYDRSGNARATGRVQGFFDFTLGSHDFLQTVYGTSLALLASDDTSKATYQRCIICGSIGATIFRGLEPSVLPVFGDVLFINQVGNVVSVNYDFSNDGATMDEVRFGFGTSAAPEPAAWALMIAGFGLAGATLRRRRALAAV